jgi:hypothetical protein
VRESIERARAELAERLRGRRGEIEAALLTRTYAIADPTETANPEYAQGLRVAVSAALDFGIEGVERGEERAPAVPVLLLAQARLAARNGVPLGTVLRRYFAGYTLLGDFIVQEAGAATLKESWLKRLLREQAAMFDRFLAAIGEEYGREPTSHPSSSEQRRTEQIERLLAGELVDTSGLAYDFEGWHLGVLSHGRTAADAIRELAGTQDCRLLLVRRDGDIAWAWLGSRRALDPAAVVRTVTGVGTGRAAIALGEPGEGLAGWRLSHRQAAAALPIARRGMSARVRYADVAVLATALQDEVLSASLRQIYLDPLGQERDGGEAARTTLRAYFSAGRNVSSAAIVLGVNRNTVASRLRAIEKRLGRPLDVCAHHLESALSLDELAAGSPLSSSCAER